LETKEELRWKKQLTVALANGRVAGGVDHMNCCSVSLVSTKQNKTNGCLPAILVETEDFTWSIISSLYEFHLTTWSIY